MFEFELGETVEIETGEYAKVIGFDAEGIILQMAETGETTRRTVEELLEVNAE